MQNQETIFDRRRFDEQDAAVAPPQAPPEEHPFEPYLTESLDFSGAQDSETFKPLFTAEDGSNGDPSNNGSTGAVPDGDDGHDSAGSEPDAASDPGQADDSENCPEPDETSPPEPVIDEAALEAARQAAHEEGRAVGRAEVEADIASTTAQALSDISKNLAGLERDWAAEMEQASADALAIGVAMVRKLFPTLKTRLAEKEIRAFVAQRLSDAGDTKTLKVQVCDDLCDAVTAQMTELAKQSGFSGSITVQSDPDLAVGDVRLDWRDGGVERVYETLWTGIEAALTRSLGPLEPSDKALAARPQKKAKATPAAKASQQSNQAAPNPPADKPPAPQTA